MVSLAASRSRRRNRPIIHHLISVFSASSCLHSESQVTFLQHFREESHHNFASEMPWEVSSHVNFVSKSSWVQTTHDNSVSKLAWVETAHAVFVSKLR